MAISEYCSNSTSFIPVYVLICSFSQLSVISFNAFAFLGNIVFCWQKSQINKTIPICLGNHIIPNKAFLGNNMVYIKRHIHLIYR